MQGKPFREDRKWWRGMLVAALFVAAVPYLVVWLAAGRGLVYTGLLFNPYDGYTYLAKMREGWMGAWRFTLPYTPHPGNGAYLYLFHLALGHLAHLLHLSVPLVYNLARVAGAVLLVAALGWYFALLFPHDAFARRFAWAVASFGLGMGWVILPWARQMPPADFWVSEAYPLLSMLTNAHFPWALAAFLVLIRPGPARWWDVLAALGLALLSPFGVVLVGFLLALQFVVEYTFPENAEHSRNSQLATRNSRFATRNSFPIHLPFPPAASQTFCRGLLVALGGLPYTAYVYWVTHHDPILAQWTAQNRTLLPPWWNLLAAFSPWAVVAVAALWRRHPAVRRLALWALAAFGLAALPSALQRRFLLGVYVPLVGLAAIWVASRPHRLRWAKALVLLVLPGALVMLLLPLKGAIQKEPIWYLSRDEYHALVWLRENTPRDAIVLASPDMGAIIPAWSGRRVLYGHPMETVDGPRYKELVGDFFRRCLKGAAAWKFLHDEGVDYIFLGPRERKLGGLPVFMPPQAVAARFGSVTIYRVPEEGGR